MERDKKVAIVILNFRGYEDTITCLNSLKSNISSNVKIIVVDNNSADGSAEKLSLIENITIINSSVNLGYAGGNNLGIRVAKDEGYEYICVLNNDTIITSDFISPIIQLLANRNDIGIIGPLILENTTEEIVQSSGAEIRLHKGIVPILNHGVLRSKITEELIPCDYVGGACMVFRSSLLDEIGDIPENYFLFYEETEWCLRTKRSGYEVLCYTAPSIIHKGSVSISKVSGLVEYLMQRNRIVFVKRNANVFQKMYFYPYLIATTLKDSLKDRKKLIYFKYYFDGFIGKVADKYKNLIRLS